ncbi:MAG: hypothetical protein Q605_AUC00220G0004 [Actinomyces urogenitalis DORA_12]|uniref:Uncharacterized protein n=1 Tax=Actinomyces urogenitalis DORA_12 TaxID=1403939 RepID=W1VRJ6_9ACTO|nr:Rv3235 family protein [Actinomyces urogenitalis]ETJ06759.1 MAG: hypothetical protein Q605_AUC00220G0004 [Actinomyces urogenitalis DORA_12]MDU0864808.1 Rv3235 family protein [Actinomyces urogenitalis]MDU0875325.1 Rv3235 family protein [Actinomyces urogenitalis]MDU1564853.1 Rv3235 family protein [Actinomyces urogenitalis]MDU1640281.1 Rv3235 family protein [Actinomyces urogenitalis]
MATLTTPDLRTPQAVRLAPVHISTPADALALAERLTSPAPELTHCPTHPLQEPGNRPGRGPARWDRFRFVPTVEQTEASIESIREARTGQEAPSSGEQSPGTRQVATATRMAQALVTAAAEVLAGLRPVDHLSGWTTPELFDALARRAGLARRILGEVTSPRPRPRRASVQLTPSGACEAMVLLDVGPQLRAAAARLEMHRGRWILAVVEIG